MNLAGSPEAPVPPRPSRLSLYLDLVRWDRPAGWLLLLSSISTITVLALALPLTLLTVFLSMLLAPWTVGKQDAIKHAAKYQSELYGLVPGQFNTSGNGRQTLFF